MIVDTHAHYIAPATRVRPYVNPAGMDPLTVDELVSEAEKAGVDRVVQVTPSALGYDNSDSLDGFRARPDKVLGVVGRFDPVASNVRERLLAYAAQSGVLSLRLTLFLEESKNWLRNRALEDFLAAAAEIDFPVCIHAPFQNREMQLTARRHPDVRFIADHMNIRIAPGMTAEQAFGDWAALCSLAQEPNVWIKVSYFPEAASRSEAYPYPTGRDRFKELYETAGANRMIWASNYPVVQRACSYSEALEFVRTECDFLSKPELAAVLGGNFMRDFSRWPRAAMHDAPQK